MGWARSNRVCSASAQCPPFIKRWNVQAGSCPIWIASRSTKPSQRFRSPCRANSVFPWTSSMSKAWLSRREGQSAWSDFEHQASRRAVGVDLIVRADNPRLRGCQLAAAVDDGGDCAQRTGGARRGAHDVHAEFHSRVRLPCVQRALYRTAQRRIEQCRVPAAVDGAKRVVVFELRCALKHRLAGLDRYEREIEGFGDGREWKLAAQHGLQQSEACFAG